MNVIPFPTTFIVLSLNISLSLEMSFGQMHGAGFLAVQAPLHRPQQRNLLQPKERKFP